MKAGNPTESIPKQQGEEGGFYLIWLVPQWLLGEKVRSHGVHFRAWFLESSTSDTNLKLVG
jgi:hypothetical protein